MRGEGEGAVPQMGAHTYTYTHLLTPSVLLVDGLGHAHSQDYRSRTSWGSQR